MPRGGSDTSTRLGTRGRPESRQTRNSTPSKSKTPSRTPSQAKTPSRSTSKPSPKPSPKPTTTKSSKSSTRTPSRKESLSPKRSSSTPRPNPKANESKKEDVGKGSATKRRKEEPESPKVSPKKQKKDEPTTPQTPPKKQKKDEPTSPQTPTRASRRPSTSVYSNVKSSPRLILNKMTNVEAAKTAAKSAAKNDKNSNSPLKKAATTTSKKTNEKEKASSTSTRRSGRGGAKTTDNKDDDSEESDKEEEKEDKTSKGSSPICDDDIIFVIQDPENLNSSPDSTKSKSKDDEVSEDGVVYSDPEEESSRTSSVQEIKDSSDDDKPAAKKPKQSTVIKVKLIDPPKQAATKSPPVAARPTQNIIKINNKVKVQTPLVNQNRPIAPRPTPPTSPRAIRPAQPGVRQIIIPNIPRQQPVLRPIRPIASVVRPVRQAIIYSGPNQNQIVRPNNPPPAVQTQYVVVSSPPGASASNSAASINAVPVTTYDPPLPISQEENPQVATLLDAMQKLRAAYEVKLATKDTEIARMKNTIKYKDEQLIHVTSVMEKNVALESRISQLLDNEEYYKMEREIHEQGKRIRLEHQAQALGLPVQKTFTGPTVVTVHQNIPMQPAPITVQQQAPVTVQQLFSQGQPVVRVTHIDPDAQQKQMASQQAAAQRAASQAKEQLASAPMQKGVGAQGSKAAVEEVDISDDELEVVYDNKKDAPKSKAAASKKSTEKEKEEKEKESSSSGEEEESSDEELEEEKTVKKKTAKTRTRGGKKEESESESEKEEKTTRTTRRSLASKAEEKKKVGKKTEKKSDKKGDKKTEKGKKKEESSDESSEEEEEVTTRRTRRSISAGAKEEKGKDRKQEKGKDSKKDSKGKAKGEKSKKTKEDSSSEEEEKEEKVEKKGKKRKTKHKNTAEDEKDIETLFVSDDERDVDDVERKKKKKKKGEKEEEKEKEEKKTEEKGDNDESKEEDNTGRHNIRKLMTTGKLQEETKTAAKEEKERRERVAEEIKKHQRVTQKDKKRGEITTKLVLALRADKKNPLVEVNTKLIRKLKPHQVDAVEFMWNCVIESIEHYRAKKAVSGCILAHRMGLGKTLSVVTFIHTLLTATAVRFKTCLIVCPLNTVINWSVEWDKWLDKKDRVDVYEMTECKDLQERADLLEEWKKDGGVMIMGYNIFRILANHSTRSKKKKKIFDESLLDPGPDIVVCDEGHILKNDSSQIAQWMNKIKSPRRIILTGTPLQNNLGEYHCMVNFVKPNLVGTRKEFSNRFVNPITNGQHVDSTPRDVKLMKKRAHVLHEMLVGVVHRRDYACLVQQLPPKYEYVISVRLSEIQMKLYQMYLEKQNLIVKEGERFTTNTLFSDYQALQRIWTHPWVLRLDEIRQEKKKFKEFLREKRRTSLDSLKEDKKAMLEYDSDLMTSDESDFESSNEDEEKEAEDSKKTKDDQKKAGSSKEPEVVELGSSSDENDSSEEEAPTRTTRTRRSAAANESPAAKGKAGQKGKDTDKDKPGQKSKDDAKPSPATRATRGRKVDEKADEKKDKKPDNKKTDSKKDSKKGGKKDKEEENNTNIDGPRKCKVMAGEVIRQWQSSYRGTAAHEDYVPPKIEQWWDGQLSEEDEKKLELSGKLLLLFEIMRMAETLGDKVLVFSQSILSLDLIEAFLSYKDEEAKAKKSTRKSAAFTHWEKNEDYVRMDGSTGASKRRGMTDEFNDASNKRLRLFLISTKAGGLGINLDSANRVIIFDASWNPSHDIQSIFRAYRFGQEKNVFIYRFLAQGTMEEKIYQRQVTKETLSQRVIDEQQIDRHFNASDLADLYKFHPDRLDDPNRKKITPKLPEDLVLRELLTSHKDWIVDYHEHDSLLEKRPEEDLTEEERKAAWDEYEREKQGLFHHNYPQPQMQMYQNRTVNLPSFGVSQPMANMNYSHPSTSYKFPSYFQNISYPKPSASVQPTPQTGSFSYQQAGVGSQVAALPKVVQEILKFNPNIAPEELQRRLQSFLGMHGGHRNVPQHQPLQNISLHTKDGRVTGVQFKYRESHVPQPVQTAASLAPRILGQAVQLPTQSSAPTQQAPMQPLAVPPQGLLPPGTTMPSRLPMPGMLPANR